MAINFPTSLDNLTNPTSTNPLTSPDHAGQHADANDAIEALQAKVGVNSSAVTTSLDYKVAQVELKVLPTGGGTGDVLAKASATNYDNTWVSRATLAADTAFTSAFASKTPTVGTSLGTTGTIDLNMSTLNDTYQSISLTGNPTFTTSNRAAGRTTTIRLVAGGSSRTLSFPSWVFVGASAPTTLAANKTAILTVTFFGTADTDGVAAYSAQP